MPNDPPDPSDRVAMTVRTTRARRNAVGAAGQELGLSASATLDALAAALEAGDQRARDALADFADQIRPQWGGAR